MPSVKLEFAEFPEVGNGIRMTYGDEEIIVEQGNPADFQRGLKALGAPALDAQRLDPTTKEDRYEAMKLASCITVEVGGVDFEFEISDRARSMTAEKIVSDITKEVADGCRGEDKK
jgi:hypothetical protein